MKLVPYRAAFNFVGTSICVSCFRNILYYANYHNCRHLGTPAHIAMYCGGSVVGAGRATGCGYESTHTSSRFMCSISIRYESARPYFYPSLNFSEVWKSEVQNPGREVAWVGTGFIVSLALSKFSRTC
jgi:hypothetical protein